MLRHLGYDLLVTDRRILSGLLDGDVRSGLPAVLRLEVTADRQESERPAVYILLGGEPPAGLRYEDDLRVRPEGLHAAAVYRVVLGPWVLSGPSVPVCDAGHSASPS